MALKRSYKMFLDKKEKLYVIMPINGNHFIPVQVMECEFMPDEQFVRFESLESFAFWQLEHSSLAKMCVNGKLNKDQI